MCYPFSAGPSSLKTAARCKGSADRSVLPYAEPRRDAADRWSRSWWRYQPGTTYTAPSKVRRHACKSDKSSLRSRLPLTHERGGMLVSCENPLIAACATSDIVELASRRLQRLGHGGVHAAFVL